MIKNFSKEYWILNLMQMVEKLSYWIIVIQLPIYIAQKDIEGGLQWEQSVKGMIFFFWAISQNLTPVFAGGLADKYGRRRIFILSFLLILMGYFLLGSMRNLPGFLGGAIIFGIGSGIFKPTLQGSLARSMKPDTSSLGWSIYIMLMNFAVFFGPPISLYLKGISWNIVFWGSGAIFATNFILLTFLGKSNYQAPQNQNRYNVLKRTIQELFKKKVIYFVLSMSGFTILYMQFYETLPNFIYDWVDTRSIVIALSLPSVFTSETARGIMISYEWLFNLNAAFIIIGVVPVALLLKPYKLTTSLLLGSITVIIGISLGGFSQLGYYTIAGMLIYTLGEMINNPKFADFMSKLSSFEDKSLYMGLMSVSWAIGLGGGGILGGYLYGILGEKSNFAIRYLSENYNIKSDHNNAMELLIEKSGMNNAEVTKLLWETYDPFLVWLPFVILGILSCVGLYFYSRKVVNQ